MDSSAPLMIWSMKLHFINPQIIKMKIMKRFIFSTMAFSLVMFYACNNASDTSSTTNDSSSATDKTVTSNDSSTNAGNSTANDVVSANGLQLTSAQEVPANTSKATGTADVSYNKSTHMLTYTLNWKDLTGNATMAHIHGTAAKGANAGVKEDLSGKIKKATSGTLSDSVMVDGSKIKEDSLLSGFYYFNIHTAKNPGGEIRTQIELK
jgi:hypothetical protein